MFTSSIGSNFYSEVNAISDKFARLSTSDAIGIVAGAAAAYYFLQTFVCDPLHDFPGPFGAKLSRIYESKVRASGKEFLVTDVLHRKYGNVVRVGRCLKVVYSLFTCIH
jgi:hypothetical protein